MVGETERKEEGCYVGIQVEEAGLVLRMEEDVG